MQQVPHLDPPLHQNQKQSIILLCIGHYVHVIVLPLWIHVLISCYNVLCLEEMCTKSITVKGHQHG